ncbi:MAG: peptidoglycan DD-metalloendopeptidase family protein [Candidatus Saganbacteria bacterium]|nr:peptidoglycan DD-metalloendopeptidase family protein [Candidatus Saganbacteria bacterium]
MFCLIFFFSAQATAQLEIEEKGKLKEIKIELERERQKLKATRQKEQEALGKLYNVNKELSLIESDLANTREKLSDNKKRIEDLSSRIKEADGSLAKKSQALKKRIAEAYKSGDANYLEILFASRSIADFINRSYYLERIISSDVELIKGIVIDKAVADDIRSELKGKTGELQVLTKVVSEKKEVAEDKATVQKRLYSSLAARRKEYERKVAELESSSRDLEHLIRAKTRAKAAPAKATGGLLWPVNARIVSGFGYRRHPIWGGRHFHTGIDLGASYGTPIGAADGGEIILSGWWDGYGKAVVIDHGSNTTTVYGHMSRIYVEKGDMVAKGQVIGLIGSTGYSTGPHLHFEVRKSGSPVDPLGFLP